MTMRGTYRGILGLLTKASERFYMLSPRCWPLLAATECLPAGPAEPSAIVRTSLHGLSTISR
jgi:hypothetical protein